MIGTVKLTRKRRDSRLWKSCGWSVEKLWISRHEKKFRTFSRLIRRSMCANGRFRAALRLLPPRISLRSGLPIVTVHTYEQEIAGRLYLIEVSPVAASRWRAQIARRPGMPTSLMPFYGKTPDEAARELSKWLSLVSAPATANT
jgi:hypothetical protein